MTSGLSQRIIASPTLLKAGPCDARHPTRVVEMLKKTKMIACCGLMAQVSGTMTCDSGLVSIDNALWVIMYSGGIHLRSASQVPHYESIQAAKAPATSTKPLPTLLSAASAVGTDVVPVRE